MSEIYSRLHIKPERPRAYTMLDQLKQLPGNQRRIEFESLPAPPVDKRHAADSKQLHFAAMRRAFERKVIGFFKDLDFFIDFCLARWIVWRELHREKKVGKRRLP
jgi:hypothetical protein